MVRGSFFCTAPQTLTLPRGVAWQKSVALAYQMIKEVEFLRRIPKAN
jgi:hypothetical protein